MKTTTLHPLRVALDIEDRTSDSHLVTYAIDVARDSGAIDRDYTEEGTPAELDALTPSIERLRLTFNIRDEVGAGGRTKPVPQMDLFCGEDGTGEVDDGWAMQMPPEETMREAA